LTGDSMPLVGPLDANLTGRDRKVQKHDAESCGEWIAAGFSGEGMVWAWLSGAALGVMIAGGEDEDLPEAPGRPGGRLSEWFPRELLVSKERMRSADVSNLAN
jgi:glycine/D-amino acid oxidase-like deaminating enzyme